MKKQPPLSWENFYSSIFVRGQERVHQVADSPLMEIFGDGVRNRVGMWLQVPKDTPIPENVLKLAYIRAQMVKRKTVAVLELAVVSPALFRNFYHFAVAVSERVLVEKKSTIEGILLELQCFAELLEEKPLLSIERQLGLIGELIVLERLIRKNGPNDVEAWIGPKREPHDFRIENLEFEVKCTVRSQRIHTIHGTEQLLPSKGCSLFIISILLGPAGKTKGFSLADKIETVSALLTGTPARMNQFANAIQGCGFRETDRTHYKRRFILRRPLAIVAVDRDLPVITRKTIQAAFGSDATRVECVQYDLNLEGLEVEDGKPGFAKIFSA